MKILLIEDDREAASYLIQALDEAGQREGEGESGVVARRGHRWPPEPKSAPIEAARG